MESAKARHAEAERIVTHAVRLVINSFALKQKTNSTNLMLNEVDAGFCKDLRTGVARAFTHLCGFSRATSLSSVTKTMHQALTCAAR